MSNLLSRPMAAFLVLAAACAVAKTADSVLLPAVREAWADVRTEAARGGAAEGTILAFDRSLGMGDYVVLPTMWTRVAPAVLEDIQRRTNTGEIGPGVADSLRERVRMFGASLDKLAGVVR